jgi:hypothetical protein
VHAWLCEGGVSEGAPLREFHSLARRQSSRALSLSAVLVAEAIEAAQSRSVVSPSPMPRTRLEQCADDGAASSAAHDGRNEECDQADDDALEDSAAEDGWSLLSAAMLSRLPPAAHAAAAPYLERKLFARCVSSLSHHLLPLETPSPLAVYCSQLAKDTGEEAAARQAAALPVLLGAVRRLWPAPARSIAATDLAATGASSAAVNGAAVNGAAVDGAETAAAAQLDALLAREAADALLEEQASGGNGEQQARGGEGEVSGGHGEVSRGKGEASGGNGEASGGNGGDGSRGSGIRSADSAALTSAVVAQRRLCLLTQCAPRLFPPIRLVAYSRSTVGVLHSCVPNVQLQLVAPTTTHTASSPPPLPPVTLATLRPKTREAEPPSIAWIDVAEASVEERAAALACRFGAGYVCVCPRCDSERQRAHTRRTYRARTAVLAAGHGAHSAAQPPEHAVMLSRDAIEDGRHTEAVALLRARLALSPTDGEAWCLLGTSLLGVGCWTEAHDAWRKGARLAVPAHPLLDQQRLKDERYHPPCDQPALPSEGADLVVHEAAAKAVVVAADTTDAPSLDCTVHTLGARRGKRLVVSTRPLFSAAECSRAIQAAEGHAASNGGWTTARHHAVPTTDIPLHECPPLLAWLTSAMETRLGPLLATHFADTVPCRAKVRVHDAFLVRYQAGAQAHLPLHIDEAHISLTIVLNEGFVGGGTFFAALGRAVSPPIGHVIAFDAEALHGGEPIVRGTRYIIAAFLYVEESAGGAADGAAEQTAAERSAPPPLEALFPQKRPRHDDAACSGDGGDGSSGGGAGGGFAFNFMSASAASDADGSSGGGAGGGFAFNLM